MRELAERAVACKHWRWMAGMALRYGGFRVLSEEENREHAIYGPDGEGDYEVIAADIYRMSPDLTDPATLGCLRHLAAKAHGAWDIVIQVDIAPRMEGTHGWWRAIDSRGRKIQGAFGTFVCPNDGIDIKVHAFVTALEAAP